jgi:hypothetical protein
MINLLSKEFSSENKLTKPEYEPNKESGLLNSPKKSPEIIQEIKKTNFQDPPCKIFAQKQDNDVDALNCKNANETNNIPNILAQDSVKNSTEIVSLHKNNETNLM